MKRRIHPDKYMAEKELAQASVLLVVALDSLMAGETTRALEHMASARVRQDAAVSRLAKWVRN